jgi:Esterase/lipase
MHLSRVFFKISDITHHFLRNYKRFPDVKREKNIAYDGRFGKFTKLDLYYPKKSEGLLPILYNVHGGGFVGGGKRYRSGIARFFASHGWFVVNIDYRLSPKYAFPAATEDVINGLNFINTLDKKYPIDLEKIVVTGDSAGGYHAAHAVAAITNPDLTKKLNLPAYTGKKLRAFLSFCAPFDIFKCVAREAPLKITLDVANCIFGTNYKTIEIGDEFKFKDVINVLDFVTPDFPESFLVAAENDSFCGGQIDGMLDKLKEKGVGVESYIANIEGDGHCTHLLPYKKARGRIWNASSNFLKG